MKLCKLCGAATECVVNVNFNAVALCDVCCLTVTKQTVANIERLVGDDELKIVTKREVTDPVLVQSR